MWWTPPTQKQLLSIFGDFKWKTPFLLVAMKNHQKKSVPRMGLTYSKAWAKNEPSTCLGDYLLDPTSLHVNRASTTYKMGYHDETRY
jgi:hypothetical protein